MNKEVSCGTGWRSQRKFRQWINSTHQNAIIIHTGNTNNEGCGAIVMHPIVVIETASWKTWKAKEDC